MNMTVLKDKVNRIIQNRGNYDRIGESNVKIGAAYIPSA